MKLLSRYFNTLIASHDLNISVFCLYFPITIDISSWKGFLFFSYGPFLKSLIEFVTILLLFYVLVFWPWGMWDRSSPAPLALEVKAKSFFFSFKICLFYWFCFFFFNFLFLLYFMLQYCVGFAIHWHESTTGVHAIPNMNPPPTSLTNIPLGHPHAPAPSMLYPASDIDWWFDSYMIVYMFQCHSPKSSHPLPLPLSPKACYTHLCLFCCLAYRVIIAIFLNSIFMC